MDRPSVVNALTFNCFTYAWFTQVYILVMHAETRGTSVAIKNSCERGHDWRRSSWYFVHGPPPYRDSKTRPVAARLATSNASS